MIARRALATSYAETGIGRGESSQSGVDVVEVMRSCEVSARPSSVHASRLLLPRSLALIQ